MGREGVQETPLTRPARQFPTLPGNSRHGAKDPLEDICANLDGRSIPAGFVARRRNTSSIPPPRASPAGRLDGHLGTLVPARVLNGNTTSAENSDDGSHLARNGRRETAYRGGDQVLSAQHLPRDGLDLRGRHLGHAPKALGRGA